jgi:hypothetical protein
MIGAGRALQAAAAAALREIEGLGVHEGPPVQAAACYAVVEPGAESDWSHKTGRGREVRLAVTLWDRGERPARLWALAQEAEAAVMALTGLLQGWRLVSVHFQRCRTVPPKAGSTDGAWAAVIEFRARMLEV